MGCPPGTGSVCATFYDAPTTVSLELVVSDAQHSEIGSGGFTASAPLAGVVNLPSLRAFIAPWEAARDVTTLNEAS